MGCNYYVEPALCGECGQLRGSRRHIGKSSSGWQFMFSTDCGRSRREVGLYLQEAVTRGEIIKDEYGKRVPLSSMLAEIDTSAFGKSHFAYCVDHYPQTVALGDTYRDEGGWTFCCGEFS